MIQIFPFPLANFLIYLVVKWVTECFESLFFRVNVLLHWLHLKSFSPVCVLMCLCKSETFLQTQSHCLHLFGSHQCVSSCVSSNLMSLRKCIDIDYTYEASHQYVSSYDFAIYRRKRKNSCIGCKCVAFLLYVSSSFGILDFVKLLRYAHIDCNDVVSPSCVSKYASSE